MGPFAALVEHKINSGSVCCRIVRYNLLGFLERAQILFNKGGNMPAEVGDVAPDFKLPSPDGDVSLADYKGEKIVVLSFHVFDFTSG
ncbi:MAG: redoxin domain-containing protein [SAR202 cluster bacterium]|nr:redoxin domain-containing protein [SAR202 cluster bacterium]MQG45510.1 redoxin domain-containing protein [SAR202 cluster bacterium]